MILELSLAENLILGRQREFRGRLGLDLPRVQAFAKERLADLDVRPADPDAAASELSGGNQQKVVIGKWLMNRPRIILLNDPTRGIDVGTKQEFYQLLVRLAESGAAIIYYSTDYDELIGCCDRVAISGGGTCASCGAPTSTSTTSSRPPQPAGRGRTPRARRYDRASPGWRKPLLAVVVRGDVQPYFSNFGTTIRRP
jgi:ABC-type sugar transport system ATPase subunit